MELNGDCEEFGRIRGSGPNERQLPELLWRV
jgi:hypothetical protein